MLFARLVPSALVLLLAATSPLAAAAQSDAAAPTAAPSCAKAVAFVGTICTPAIGGRRPAIVLLGGSEGGDSTAPLAREFAEHGSVAASVAYFGAPGLPPALAEIPVETITRAIDDLVRRDDVDPARLSIFGISKGGELALLTASGDARISKVVAVVPSPYAWQDVPRGASDPAVSSWTRHGKQLPYVPYTEAIGRAYVEALRRRIPLALRGGYVDASKDTGAVDRAMFPLERIAGPVLFVAAGDDQIWDSAAQSARGLACLSAHHHPYRDAIVEEPHAGHLFLLATPERPFTDAPFRDGLRLALGGTAEANVVAAGDAWPKIAAFLESAGGAVSGNAGRP